jgi:RNA recognition motif-containing protein
MHQITHGITPPDPLIGEAPKNQACVFMRNIAFDCDDEELKKTLNTVGPFRDMKMLIGDDNKSKGYGFCTYNDPDTASSALRNLDKINVNKRILHVSYASDQQSSTNLKPEDARERDPSEIIITKTGARSAVTSDIKVEEELLSPQTSTVDDMLRSLSSG